MVEGSVAVEPPESKTNGYERPSTSLEHPVRQTSCDPRPLHSAPCCRDQLKDVGYCDLHLLGQTHYQPSRHLLPNPIIRSHRALHSTDTHETPLNILRRESTADEKVGTASGRILGSPCQSCHGPSCHPKIPPRRRSPDRPRKSLHAPLFCPRQFYRFLFPDMAKA